MNKIAVVLYMLVSAGFASALFADAREANPAPEAKDGQWAISFGLGLLWPLFLGSVLADKANEP